MYSEAYHSAVLEAVLIILLTNYLPVILLREFQTIMYVNYTVITIVENKGTTYYLYSNWT